MDGVHLIVPYGVTGALADPQITVHDASDVIATNDNWSGAEVAVAASTAGAFPLTEGSKDAALVLTLAPGIYTAQVRGVAGTTGVALLEVYELP